jgi:hypothetical protein
LDLDGGTARAPSEIREAEYETQNKNKTWELASFLFNDK